METKQSPTTKNPTGAEVQPQQVSSNNNKLFVVVAASVLLTAIISGSAVYFWQKSANEKAVNSLEQKIASLEEQISETKYEGTVTQPTAPPASSPTPIDNGTKNWKIYKNDDFNFQFNYPPEWDFKLGTGQAFLFQASLKKEDGSQQPVEMLGGTTVTPYYQILISAQNNPKNLSAKDFYLKDYSPEVRGDVEKKLQETNIAGENAIKYQEGSAPSSGPATTISISHDNTIYQFSYGAMAHKITHEKYITILNQILSTFQFTN